MTPRHYSIPAMTPDMATGGPAPRGERIAPRGMVADGGPRNVPTIVAPVVRIAPEVQARMDRYEAQNAAEARSERRIRCEAERLARLLGV